MRVPLFVILAILGGCDRTVSTPTAPTPPQPTPTAPAVTFLRIDATSIGRGTQAALTVGQTHQLFVRGSLAGGGQIDVTPVWQVDNRGVLTIDSQGRITGVSNGWATVLATYSGMAAMMVVRVASDFGGSWIGSWRLVRCETTDGSFCSQRYPTGSQRPLQLSIIMDRNFAIVRLSWDLDGTLVMVFSSLEVGEDGSLSFGRRFADSRGFEVPLVAASWRAQLTGPDLMTGRMTLIHGAVDAARTEWELVNASPRRE